MNDKTVTMNYVEHEKMIKDFEELKKAKLCILDINIHTYSFFNGISGHLPFNSFHYMITAEPELKEKITAIMKNFEHEILMPYRERVTVSDMKIIEMDAQIEFLKSELIEAKKQKRWGFWT